MEKLGRDGGKSWSKFSEVLKILLVRVGSIWFGGIEKFCSWKFYLKEISEIYWFYNLCIVRQL